MWTWLKRNADGVEAGSAAVTALVAVLALLGVVWQVRAASEVQAQQSARDAYRNHLALAVTVPELAEPQDACAVMAGEKAPAYDAFVGHLLYAAEQMLEVDPSWKTVFERELQPHAAYICRYQEEFLTFGELDRVMKRFVREHCPTTPPCG